MDEHVKVPEAEENRQCPLCGCDEIGIGKQYGPGRMYPDGGIFSLGSEVYAEICTNCGYILSMWVKNPERFKQSK